MIGRVVDRKYRIIRLLGEGGMGSVWEAENLSTRRRVAVKLIKPQYAASPDIAKRFYREAQAVSALSTAHVVQVYDCAQDPETCAPYMVMELLQGEDVGALSRRLEKLAPDLALRICAQALVGLSAAHAAGIVHRDIKPSNLFLARGDRGAIVVKLLDFGIAKELGAEGKETKLTQTGAPLGSPEYMSPEQVYGFQLDHRTDVWSMGAVLYECLAARSPYEGARTEFDLKKAITASPPRPVQDYAKWVSRDVAAVVHGALAWITDRYPSADAMLEAVRSLLPYGFELREDMLRPMGVDSRGTAGERFAVKAYPPEAATNPGVTTPPRPPLRPMSLAALIVLFVVVFAMLPVAVFAWRSRQPPTVVSAEPSAERVTSAAASGAVAPTVSAPATLTTAQPIVAPAASSAEPVAPAPQATANATSPRRPSPKPRPAAPPVSTFDGVVRTF